MIKLMNNKYYRGMEFRIRNAWKRLIIEGETFPLEYKITDILIHDDKTVDYLCKSVCSKDKKGEKVRKIIVTNNILNYLFGEEVPNSNVGLYFGDYFPFENDSLLIKSNNQIDNEAIYPVTFNLYVEDVLIGKQTIPKIDFILNSLMEDVQYTIESQNNNSWKFLNEADTYMLDSEKLYQDTFIHKAYVLQVCNLFSDYLEEQNQVELAEELRAKAIIHDNSKILDRNEFKALIGIINDKSCLQNSSAKLSTLKQDAIELHWENNSHHPEHFESIYDMSKLDKIEMVCDWAARSIQYKTDLADFFEKRQESRFHFPLDIYNELRQYIDIVLKLLKND